MLPEHFERQHADVAQQARPRGLGQRVAAAAATRQRSVSRLQPGRRSAASGGGGGLLLCLCLPLPESRQQRLGDNLGAADPGHHLADVAKPSSSGLEQEDQVLVVQQRQREVVHLVGVEMALLQRAEAKNCKRRIAVQQQQQQPSESSGILRKCNVFDSGLT